MRHNLPYSARSIASASANRSSARNAERPRATETNGSVAATLVPAHRHMPQHTVFARVVDPVDPPAQLDLDQLKLATAKRMERVCDPEPSQRLTRLGCS